jgi:transcription antitermination factor NusG
MHELPRPRPHGFGLRAPGPPAGEIPNDVWLEWAKIQLLDPEPALLALWMSRLAALHRPLGPCPGDGVSQWYVVKTAPQAERKAAYALSQEGLSVFVPIETDWGKLHGRLDKSRYVYGPLLPGYFFVLIDPAYVDEKKRTQFRQVLEVEGVVGFIDCIEKGERRPFPIPVEAIIEMQADERAGRYDLTRGRSPTPPAAYRPKKGERVQVIAGPYLTYIGQVIAAPKKNRVKVALEDGRSPMLKVSHIAAAS